MHCPECGGEYRPGIEVCPTCDVPLTSETSSGSHGGRGPRLIPALIDLIGYVDESEAREVRSRLKKGGIPCELVIRDADGADSRADGNDEYWIRIPGARVQDATNLLDIGPILSETACPSCGAHLEEDQDCATCTP